MNSKIFRQYDGPWAKKPYPTKGCTVSGAGCGLVACTHIAIEQEDKKDWTPETLRPYMLKYAVAGQGTTWDGITKTLQYLGHKVKYITEATPMKDAFAELNKGNRIGIILFYGGYSKRYKKWYRTPDGTVWTGNGHYMMFGSYKYENGKHWFYMKDSGGRKHDGWYSYESSMKGCVGQMWIVERTGVQTTSPKATTADGKLVVDGVGGVATVKAMQRFFGVTQDGIISSQNKNLKRYYSSLKSVSYSDKPKGSLTVEKMQTWLGISADGIWGKETTVALQNKLGVKADGKFGPESMKAWQKYLNEHDKAVYPPAPKPTPTLTPKPTPTPTPSKKVYIGQACSDRDKKAGDSSGKEVTKSSFTYSSSSTSCYNWTYIFRPKDSKQAEKAASMCEKAIANNNIGYSKSGETAYGKSKAMTKLAKSVNYDLSKITVKCGLSCGDLICLCNRYAGLSTCYIGSGLQLANNLKKNSNFECIKYKKGITLKRGDTIITAHSNGKHNHVAMVL